MVSSGSERKWSMFCHLSAYIAILGVPLGHILGPLLVWLVKRDESAEIREHGRQALNFQLSMTVYATALAIAGASSFLMAVPWGTDFWNLDPIPVMRMGPVLIAIIFGVLFFLVMAADFVLVFVNALRAYDGQSPRYFFVIPFIGGKRLQAT